MYQGVRFVTEEERKVDKREKLLPYVPKPLAEIKLGVQRVAVIWPVEGQVGSDNREHVEVQVDDDNSEQVEKRQGDAEAK